MDQISEPLKADSSPQMCFVCWHYVGSHKFSILTSFLNCFLAECVHAKLFQSCPTLCNSMDYSPPGSFAHGILQARILECVLLQGIFLTQESNSTLMSPALASELFTTSATREAHYRITCVIIRYLEPFYK